MRYPQAVDVSVDVGCVVCLRHFFHQDLTRSCRSCILSVVFGDASGGVLASSVPYRQELGRVVRWLVEDRVDVDEDAGGGFVELLGLLFSVVDPVPWPDVAPPRVFMLEVARQVELLGFDVVCGLPGSSTVWDVDF